MADKTISVRGPSGPVEVLYHDNGDGTYSQGAVNASGTALVSLARTATANASDIINYSHRGIILFLNVTVAGVDGGLTPVLQAKNPITSTYGPVFTAAAPVTDTGLKMYLLYPGASTAGGYVSATSQALPQTFRVSVTAGNSTSYTYSVGYQLLQ